MTDPETGLEISKHRRKGHGPGIMKIDWVGQTDYIQLDDETWAEAKKVYPGCPQRAELIFEYGNGKKLLDM